MKNVAVIVRRLISVCLVLVVSLMLLISPAIADGFPDGDFRIINQDTGQALYVKLGKVGSINYYRLGNTTTYYISEKPTVDIRQATGGAEEAWYFDAGKDGWGTPRNKTVSVVVGRDTNLGNHCLSAKDSGTLYMYGCGANDSSRWQSADGYIGILNKNLYLTVANGSLTLQPKDDNQSGQRWRFEDPK